MNTPPDRFVRVREDRLLAFVAEAFRRCGCDHADLIARLLVNNDLRGVRSHGTRAAGGYCRGLAEGALNPTPDVRLLHETGATAVIDGDGAPGYLPMVRAAEAAVARARSQGVGVGLARHIGHYGSAGHYTRICAEAGCVGFSVQGYRNEADASGRETKPFAHLSGDPPISFAYPGWEEEDIVHDGGTNLFGPYHDEEFADLPQRIPATVFKSMGFIATATLIGGALTGYTDEAGDEIADRWPGARMGGTVVAFDPERLHPGGGYGERFRREVDRYVRDLSGTHAPVPGTDRVRLPGQLEAERMVEYRRDGIPFGEPEQESIRGLAERFELALPWDEEAPADA